MEAPQKTERSLTQRNINVKSPFIYSLNTSKTDLWLWRRGQEQEVVLERGGGFATLLKATASSIAQICLIQNSCPPLPLCLEVVMISCCWEPWAAPLFCIDFPLLALIL